MDIQTFRAMSKVMAVVRGKTEATYYYDLCACYSHPLCHPPDGVSGAALVTAAEGGCWVCSIVRDALIVGSGAPINPEFKIICKTRERYGIRISYMKEGEWSTRQKLEAYPSPGE